MDNQQLINLAEKLVGKEAELFILSEKVRVLTYAMLDVPDNDTPDREVLRSIIMDYLKPHLPKGE